jgi:hypothetical protein
LKKRSVSAAAVVWPPIDSCGTSAREFWCCLFCEPTQSSPRWSFHQVRCYTAYIYKRKGLVNIVTSVFFFFGSASSWERSVGSLYHKFWKAQFEDPPHSKSLILSNYWQFQLFLFCFFNNQLLQMDWLTQLMGE